MKLSSRNEPIDYSDVDIHLRMGKQKANHLIEHGPSCMHHIQTQLRVSKQYVFKQQRIAQAHPVLRRADVRSTRRAEPDMDTHRKVQLFSEGIVRLRNRSEERRVGKEW